MNKLLSLPPSLLLEIDHILHTTKKDDKSFLNDEDHTVVQTTIAGNGCRQIVYRDVYFMEQNSKKLSRPAEYASRGHQISWQMSDGVGTSYPVCIVDRKIYYQSDKKPWE